MFVGCFFSLNLFVGAIVDNFTQIKKENDGSATMTAEQRQWTETMSLSMNKKGARALLPPRQSARRALFKVVQSQPFELFIMAVIICNVLRMACDYWKFIRRGRRCCYLRHRRHSQATDGVHYWKIEDDALTFVTDATKYITYIYYVEATFVFKDAWCQFDFFLVSRLDDPTELLAGVLPLTDAAALLPSSASFGSCGCSSRPPPRACALIVHGDVAPRAAQRLSAAVDPDVHVRRAGRSSPSSSTPTTSTTTSSLLGPV